jgi:gliding motility-associatede transport system auxiliary component
MARDAVTSPPAGPGVAAVLGRESTRRFLLLALELVFLIVIIISVGQLCIRTNLRFDLTPNQKYSLSEVTIQTMKSLSQPVQATTFYRRGDREKYDELMTMLQEANPQLFSYQLFDLDRAPGAAQRYGVSAYGATVVETASNRVTIPVSDEERMLNAVLRVMQSEKTMYFVTGHGENDPTDAEERTGYGVLRRVLETENYRVRPLPLRQADAVPRDADLVIISGPREDFSPSELQALSAYFAGGGNGLFMLDPFMTPGLSQYLTQFGFALAEDLVVDTQTQVSGGDPLMPIIGTFAKEVFPRDPRGEPMLPIVRPVRVRDGKARAFAFSGDSSWALKNRSRAEQGDLTFVEGEDERGPLPIAAVATTGDKQSGKVVVIGDSNFADNFYARVPGNVDFFMNTVGWMLGRQELVALGRTANVPETKRNFTPQQSLYLSASQSRLFFWLMVVVEPLAVFLVGMAVFARRRQRG